MYRLRNVLAASLIIAFIASCAFDLVQVKQIPAQLVIPQYPNDPFYLEQEVNISLGTGYSRVLKQGTKWYFAGRIPNGDVYRTNDQVLTVEASNIH